MPGCLPRELHRASAVRVRLAELWAREEQHLLQKNVCFFLSSSSSFFFFFVFKLLRSKREIERRDLSQEVFSQS